MKAWEEYAYIVNDKVQNIGVYAINSGAYTLANIISKDLYGSTAIAVNVNQYPVQPGDDYDGEHFSRLDADGNRIIINPLPTDEQQINALVAENAQTSEALDDVIIAITPTEAN